MILLVLVIIFYIIQLKLYMYISNNYTIFWFKSQIIQIIINESSFDCKPLNFFFSLFLNINTSIYYVNKDNSKKRSILILFTFFSRQNPVIFWNILYDISLFLLIYSHHSNHISICLISEGKIIFFLARSNFGLFLFDYQIWNEIQV